MCRRYAEILGGTLEIDVRLVDTDVPKLSDGRRAQTALVVIDASARSSIPRLAHRARGKKPSLASPLERLLTVLAARRATAPTFHVASNTTGQFTNGRLA